jgi:CHAT domain-containing protein
MMNDKEFEKAQASIMNKKAKLMKLRSDRAETCKKMSEIEQAIVRTEKELLGEENDFIVLCGQKSQLLRERALQVGEEIEQAIRPQQPVDKLTILFLAANPQDTQKLALDKEVRSITDAIRRSEGRDGIEFFSRWAVQSLDILQAINETDPEIIHFSGHGSEKGEIVLDDGSGNMAMVSKEAMAAAVASASKKVRLIFFNACFSQKEAQAVVEKVEAAIGMNTEIGDEAAIVFAAQFYSSVGFGQNLQQALDQAKAALLLKGIAEENTPVLYVKKGLSAQEIVMVESEAAPKSGTVSVMQRIKNIFS